MGKSKLHEKLSAIEQGLKNNPNEPALNNFKNELHKLLDMKPNDNERTVILNLLDDINKITRKVIIETSKSSTSL